MKRVHDLVFRTIQHSLLLCDLHLIRDFPGICASSNTWRLETEGFGRSRPVNDALRDALLRKALEHSDNDFWT